MKSSQFSFCFYKLKSLEVLVHVKERKTFSCSSTPYETSLVPDHSYSIRSLCCSPCSTLPVSLKRWAPVRPTWGLEIALGANVTQQVSLPTVSSCQLCNINFKNGCAPHVCLVFKKVRECRRTRVIDSFESPCGAGKKTGVLYEKNTFS